MLDKIEINDIEHLLGKPWVRAAEGPDAYDCWGLVKHILSLMGKDYEYIKIDYNFPNGIEHEFSEGLKFWDELEEASENCIVFGYRGNIPIHIGFVVGSWVVHSVGDECTPGSVALTKLKNFKRLYNRIGFFTWRA